MENQELLTRDQELLTSTEIAERLGISSKTVWQHMAMLGIKPVVRANRRQGVEGQYDFKSFIILQQQQQQRRLKEEKEALERRRIALLSDESKFALKTGATVIDALSNPDAKDARTELRAASLNAATQFEDLTLEEANAIAEADPLVRMFLEKRLALLTNTTRRLQIASNKIKRARRTIRELKEDSVLGDLDWADAVIVTENIWDEVQWIISELKCGAKFKELQRQYEFKHLEEAKVYAYSENAVARARKMIADSEIDTND